MSVVDVVNIEGMEGVEYSPGNDTSRGLQQQLLLRRTAILPCPQVQPTPTTPTSTVGGSVVLF